VFCTEKKKSQSNFSSQCVQESGSDLNFPAGGLLEEHALTGGSCWKSIFSGIKNHWKSQPGAIAK